jgi:hypothetical protein
MRKGVSKMLYVLTTLCAMLAVTVIGLVVLYQRICPHDELRR